MGEFGGVYRDMLESRGWVGVDTSIRKREFDSWMEGGINKRVFAATRLFQSHGILFNKVTWARRFHLVLTCNCPPFSYAH